MKKEKGAILITAYLVLFVLIVLGGIFFSRTLSEKKLYDLSQDRVEALYLAEAGVDKALACLKNAGTGFASYTESPSLAYLTNQRGQYETTITSITSIYFPTRKRVLSTGYVPDKANYRARRQIEAIVKKETPFDFFKHAIYSAGDITLEGNTYSVQGDPNGYPDILFADSLNWDPTKDHVESDPSDVDPDEYQDPSIKPLAKLDFAILRALAIAQGNYYDANRLKDVQTGKDSYPSCGSCTDCPGMTEGADCCFWQTCPSNPSDVSTGMPRVVYVEGDLVLNGDIGEIGGFFVVVGNVLTDPDDTGSSTINGNGDIRGCIYTSGKFSVNGGGGDLNVDGGIWAGSEAEMRGNSTIQYNATFMSAIKSMIEQQGIGPAVQLVSWREMETIE